MPVDHKLENRTSAVPGLQTYDNRVNQAVDLSILDKRIRSTVIAPIRCFELDLPSV